MTAAKVARVLVFAGHHPTFAPLLPKHAAATSEALLLASGAMQPWMQRFYANARNRAWLERVAERLGPGQFVRIALRKRFMDDEIRAAIAAGATQVLVVGAGYDTACMRLASAHPQVQFVEIDHPATHARKRHGLVVLDAERPNLRLLAADLAATTLVEALADLALDGPAWDPAARTVVVAEGLLMYLDWAAIARAFTALHDLTGPGSRVAFSYVGCDADGQPAISQRIPGLTRWALAWLGEPLRWCVRDEAELTRELAPLGWAYAPEPERFDLAARYLAPVGLDDRAWAEVVEFMAVVERRGV